MSHQQRSHKGSSKAFIYELVILSQFLVVSKVGY